MSAAGATSVWPSSTHSSDFTREYVSPGRTFSMTAWQMMSAVAVAAFFSVAAWADCANAIAAKTRIKANKEASAGLEPRPCKGLFMTLPSAGRDTFADESDHAWAVPGQVILRKFCGSSVAVCAGRIADQWNRMYRSTCSPLSSSAHTWPAGQTCTYRGPGGAVGAAAAVAEGGSQVGRGPPALALGVLAVIGVSRPRR
jgi:hypothetical protein